MKNLFSYCVWLVANFIALATYLILLRDSSNDFVICLNSAIYIYVVALAWDALVNHVTLSAEINDYAFERTKAGLFMDELSNYIIAKSSYFLILVPIYYWLFRFPLLLILWLKDGFWNEFTTCDVLQSFCDYQSKAVGLNKIVLWVGANDFGIFLTVVCVVFAVLVNMHPKSNWLA